MIHNKQQSAPPLPPPIRPTPKKKKVVNKRVHRQPQKPNRQVRLPIRKELSAGGVVVRQDDGKYLVALLQTEHKRGLVWVLPKGHVELDAGESVSNGAKREVEEEAGLKDLAIKNQLGITRFKFRVENAMVHKTVHYFLMTTTQKKLIPQAEERMLDAKWFDIDEAVSSLAYDTDQEIVSRAKEYLTKKDQSKNDTSLRQYRIHV